MNVLVLGGTVFLGRALVAALTGRGHRVTTFTRGIHPVADAPPAIRLHGDREHDLATVPAGGWDAVIDTSGYRPAIVALSAEHLQSARAYIFVSTVSVYDETLAELREDSPLAALPDGVEDDAAATYGPLKAQCEAVVREQFGDRATIVRPGLIVGPHDPSDRFTYWPERADRGGTILAPAPPSRFVQFIDVRDVAGFIVRLAEDGRGGTFNVTGLPNATPLGAVVDACRNAAGTPSDVAWVDDEFLVLHNVGPWMELPLWVPDSAGIPGIFNADVSRALSAGLRLRTLDETVRDTLAWARTRPHDGVRRAGLTAEREAELLEAWRERGAPDPHPTIGRS
jgi:2'-hydroxyisoflavone reductase